MSRKRYKIGGVFIGIPTTDIDLQGPSVAGFGLSEQDIANALALGNDAMGKARADMARGKGRAKTTYAAIYPEAWAAATAFFAHERANYPLTPAGALAKDRGRKDRYKAAMAGLKGPHEFESTASDFAKQAAKKI